MKVLIPPLALIIILWITGYPSIEDYFGSSSHSCSTFLLPLNKDFYVGHNLDGPDDYEGMIVINKRGILKENISWEDLKSSLGRESDAPRIKWISKYGSITYNTFGQEFIDGGLNEAGLYVGEMTLLGSTWPNSHLPALDQHQWMQYLLDNFDSVDGVINSLQTATVDGHSPWHFFVADRYGNSAIIEFIDGNPVVYQNEKMPYKALFNSEYAYELDKIKQFKGYGGHLEIEIQNKNVDNRFVWAVSLINSYALKKNPSDPIEYSFHILDELDLGNNKWSIIYDITNRRMYFRTKKAKKIRYVDFSSFNFSCSEPILALDINQDLSGDVSNYFKPYTDELNGTFISNALDAIDTGYKFWVYLFYQISFKNNLQKSVNTFSCIK